MNFEYTIKVLQDAINIHVDAITEFRDGSFVNDLDYHRNLIKELVKAQDILNQYES